MKILHRAGAGTVGAAVGEGAGSVDGTEGSFVDGNSLSRIRGLRCRGLRAQGLKCF